ncbi:thioredoxin domain-containing protein [Pseudenhygromyxa sp. WMMC2535]|uniref:thioredoxin domain-containing protein n=1 Tax=Pseudenhygromyxa sp. WMMC2535 TaxID=2712867 RepID=UPI0015569E47|nr:DUF255 domain-containing protein [Pseudenhygromyxa sp. WMMC2535]NVB37275.1 thioredoxin domain-containing protein [Pseudenhygromyxa sp. WMMC2535]NVB43611.1 thioredoxin domain-containing protein [Pseudenhygromyxa sp. WMMC2535]
MSADLVRVAGRTNRLARALGLCTLACALACSAQRDRGQAEAPAEAAPGELAWSAWDPASFERAADEDRLILINVVAQWCHWCHVMETTTYRDPEVQALLRAHFVIIRVDSDARPDLLERYRRWGWPATAILSPAAEPAINLRGYREPERFAALLRTLVAEHEAGELRRFDENGDQNGDEPASIEDQDLESLRLRVAANLDGLFDPEGLGWGRKQKYPWPGPIDYALLRARLRPDQPDEARWRERALATLAAERALIDPVWGGMYQYSLRGVWDRPHFEKIAMVQAGGVENYAHAAMVTGDPRWLADARELTRYLLERMQDPRGGFYSSQDADLRRHDGEDIHGDEFYALDDASRRALGQPRIDTAIYADLNGLIIHALTELDRAAPDEDLRAAAVRAGERLLATHRTPAGAFTHADVGADVGADAGAPVDDAQLHLGDQSAVGLALLGLHRVTGEARWLDAARELAAAMVDVLAAADGGFYAHGEDPQAIGVFAQRRKPLPENARAARFLIELAALDARADEQPSPWLDLARATLLALGPEHLAARSKLVGDYLIALEQLAGPRFDLSVVGEADDPRTDALWRAALGIYEPRATVERSSPGVRYPDTGAPAVYLCSDRACSRPLRDPDTLAAEAEAFFSSP